MVGALATLRIATLADPAIRVRARPHRGGCRVGIHLLGLHEVLLVPPVMRAMHRARSRVFLEKTTKEILEAVLTGDPKMKVEDPRTRYRALLCGCVQAPPKESGLSAPGSVSR
ncbi:MAG: hypothetical protein IPG04_16630 [Polyangiaceae bacterium]|nr:hypothetical protein [Polyangiaceae bacterium]